MSRLISLLAALTIGSIAHAEDKKAASEFTPDGQIRVKAKVTKNKGLVEKGTDTAWTQRTRFGANFRANEKVTGRLSLIAASQWGDGNDFTGSVSASNENVMITNEAWAGWMVNDALMVKMGKFPIQVGNGLIFDINDDFEVPVAFQGLQFAYDMESVRIDFYNAKLAEYDTSMGPPTTAYSGMDDSEKNLYLLSADLKGLPEAFKNVNVHLAQITQSWAATADDDERSENQMRYGFTVGGNAGPADYAFTYHAQSGTAGQAGQGTGENDLEGTLMHLDAGFNMPNIMDSRVGLVYHTDSGDKGETGKTSKYDPVFWHRWGYASPIGVVGFGNMTQTGLNYALKPADGLKVLVSYDMFTKTEKTDFVYGEDGASLPGTNTGSETDVGSEWSVKLMKEYESASVMFRVGSFSPGKVLKDASLDESNMEYYLKTTFNF
jgi:hypothetical protein